MDFVQQGFAAHRANMPDEAQAAFDAALAGNPADGRAAFGLGMVAFERGHLGEAIGWFERAIRFEPDDAAPINELGRVYQKFGDYDRAAALFKHALEVDDENVAAMANYGMCLMNMGDIGGAETWTRKAIDGAPINADLGDAWRNLSLVLLHKQDWRKGWKLYAQGLGYGDRKRRHFSLPQFDPSYKGKKVVIYGEQGVGDQILFGSCIPDVLAKNDVIIETEPRLAPLFARAFPEATVYDTMRGHPWWRDEEKPDSCVAMGNLPKHFRNTDEDFPGLPYLMPNKAMAAMVQGLLSTLPRKKRVGVAWTGGTQRTGRERRSTDIRTLMAAMDGVDAEFISLEHTPDPEVDPRECGVHVFDFLTSRNLDMDYPAALVDQLDAVISVPTATVHLAGALGVPTLVMLGEGPTWTCGGPTMPWWNSVEVMRDWTPESVAARLNEVLSDGAE